MSLLRKIFGKKNLELTKDSASQSSENTYKTLTAELFHEECLDSLKRYHANPEHITDWIQSEINSRKIQEHDTYSKTYESWKTCDFAPERRSVLYRLWDTIEFEKLEKWQVIERYVKDRYALSAYEFHKTQIVENDYQDIRILLALSKLYRTLESNSEAMHFAQMAYQLQPHSDAVKTEYAHALNLTNTQENIDSSHLLINEVIDKKTSTRTQQK